MQSTTASSTEWGIFNAATPANRPKQIPSGSKFQDFKMVKLGRKHYAFIGKLGDHVLPARIWDVPRSIRVEFKCSYLTAIRRMQAAIVTARLTQ